VDKLRDIALVTYTNSMCHDVLRPHVGQLEKFAGSFNSYILSNDMPQFGLNTDKHEVILYDNSDSYYTQWVKCLEHVKEDYIVYLQEDFFLYGDVNYEEILRCKDFLDGNDYSFVRFGKFELRLGMHRSEFQIKDFPDIKLDENIFDAYCHDRDCYAFMMQATLWKKSDYIKLYHHVKSDIWHEAPKWNEGMRDLGTKGAFYHSPEMKQLGKWHWESKLWPHICTAVGYGKWSLTHHDHRLTDILSEYNIDPNGRGVR